jgi:HK97 family phage portal protein
MPFFNTPLSDKRRQPRASLGTRVMADMVGSRYGNTPPATTWSGQRYEQVLHFKYWVRVAIHCKANRIASKMPNVSRITASHDLDPRHKWLPHGSPKRLKAQTPLRDSEDLEPLEHDHDLVYLLNHPNQYETAFQIWYQTVMFLGLCGEAFWWTPLDDFGMPAEIHVIPSHWMTPRCYHPQDGHIVDYYDCRPLAGGGYQAMHFPADEIVHFKYPSPISKITGASPLAAGDRWFDISESVDQSRWNAMKQSINASGVIELSGDYYDPDDAEINRLQVKFLQNAGERRTGKPIILSPGMRFTPLMVSARELDHVGGADQIRDMCLSMFGCPKGAVGVGSGDMSRANLEGLLVGFYSGTINPETKNLGETATTQLAKKFDNDAVIWWEDGSPSDSAQVNADFALDIQAGSITKGEARQLRGRQLFGDERDDEIAGVPSQPEGQDGMPMDLDNLFGEPGDDADPDGGQGQTAGGRMTQANSNYGQGDSRSSSPFFASANGNGNGKGHR